VKLTEGWPLNDGIPLGMGGRSRRTFWAQSDSADRPTMMLKGTERWAVEGMGAKGGGRNALLGRGAGRDTS